LYNTHKLCGEDPAEGINRRLFRYEEEDSMKKQKISDAVIHRLPRYYRYLDDLYNKGVVRISSSSLGDKMDITASQIRQDLSCFGEFGQQGYGYNVAELRAMAQRNAERNGLDNMDFLCEDTFELLPRLEKEGHPYDFIILDPPAFTKSRRTVDNAMRGYKEINYRAMKLLPRGGYLATASCSHFATEELFIKMLHAAAKDAHRQLRQIEVKQQAPDHPILWGVPETNYLKFFLFQVI
jgi:hypothetical protein